MDRDMHAASVELPEFLPLTALYIGRFASTNHAVIFLWVSGFGSSKGLPKRLVLVVIQDETKPQPARTLQRLGWAMRGSPFFAPPCGKKGPLRGVCTFEVDLREIVGLDYWNPLLVDSSRLVIEARELTKRWFPTLESCWSHYGWQEKDTGAGDPSMALSRWVKELYRPSTGRCGPALPQVVPQSEFISKSESPTKEDAQKYWLERSEQRNYERLNRVFLTAERWVRPNHEEDLSPLRPRRLSVSSPRHDGEGGTGGPGVSELADKVSSNDLLPELLEPTSEIISCVTVHFRFDDPFLPYVLREVVHDPEHPGLLRLYEAGLPSWAILLPQYTGFYRRWMRIVMGLLLLLLSCVSMLLGFYDLYRRIPAVKVLLMQALGPLSSTLEELVVVRLSVLLGWMLPHTAIARRLWIGVCFLSELLRASATTVMWFASELVAWASWFVQVPASLLTPLVSFGPLGSVVWAVKTCWQAGLGVVRGLLTAGLAPFRGFLSVAGTVISTVRPGRTASQISAAGLLQAEFTLARQAFMGIYNGTILLGAKIARHQASMRLAFQRWRLRWRRRIVSFASRRPCPTLTVLIFALVAAHVERVGWEAAVQDVAMTLGLPSQPWLPRLCPTDHLVTESTQLERVTNSSWVQLEGGHRQLHLLDAEPSRTAWLQELMEQALERLLSVKHSRHLQEPEFVKSLKMAMTDLWFQEAGPRLCPVLLQYFGTKKEVGKVPQQDPQVLAIDLLCWEDEGQIGSHSCWRRETGGRRCLCPYGSIGSLNITTSAATDFVVEVQPSVHRNGSTTMARTLCEAQPRAGKRQVLHADRTQLQGGQDLAEAHSPNTAISECELAGPTLRSVLTGGAAEIWVQAPGRGSLRKAAAFLLDAPRLPPAAPHGLRVCTLATVEESDSLFPLCADPILGAGDLPELQNRLRAEWTQDFLGSCLRPRWQVQLDFGGEQLHDLCKITGSAGTSSKRTAMSCEGRRPNPMPATGDFRASVELSCLDEGETPLLRSSSSRYKRHVKDPESYADLDAGTSADTTEVFTGLWQWCPLQAASLLALGAFLVKVKRASSTASKMEQAHAPRDIRQAHSTASTAAPAAASGLVQQARGKARSRRKGAR